MIRKFMTILAAFCGALCVGCASSSTQLYQAIGASDAAVQAATTLVVKGTITPQQGKSVWQGFVGVEGGLKVWNDGIKNSAGSDALLADARDALDEVGAALQTLQIVQQQTVALRNVTVRYRAPTSASQVSSGSVITLLELAISLAPDLKAAFDSIFNTQAVSQITIDSSLDTFDVHLIALHTAVVAASPAPTPATP